MPRQIHEKRAYHELGKLASSSPPSTPSYILRNNFGVLEMSFDGLIIIVNENYPFHPPNIFVGKERHPYRKYLILATNLLGTKGCLACSSIVCGDNWSPACGIAQILEEYRRVADQIKSQRRIKIGNIILARHRLGDLDLSPYLNDDENACVAVNRRSENPHSLRS